MELKAEFDNVDDACVAEAWRFNFDEVEDPLTPPYRCHQCAKLTEIPVWELRLSLQTEINKPQFAN